MFLWRRKWQPTPVFWRIPWTEELGGLPSTVTKRHDWASSLSLHFMFLVYFFFLSLPCSATSELPASLILYLSLKSFQPLLLQIFFSTVSFFPSSTTNAHINFAIVLYLLDTMLSFPSLSLSLSFCLYLGTFGDFLLTYFQCHWIFCHFVGDIISVQCFWFLAFPFGSFLEFPSLLLWYTYFLAYCLLSH